MKNKSILNEPIFDSDECNYCDWLATIMFYSALHLVEKELVSSGHGVNPNEKSDHKKRKQRIEQHLEPEIAASYRVLFNMSMKARYQCFPIEKSEIKKLSNHLSEIEKRIQAKA